VIRDFLPLTIEQTLVADREATALGGQGREFGELHCQLGQAVQIESGLRYKP